VLRVRGSWVVKWSNGISEGSIPLRFVVNTIGPYRFGETGPVRGWERPPVTPTGTLSFGIGFWGQNRNSPIMGLRSRLSGVARQAKTAMTTHQGSIERGIDKAGDLANNKTGAKHDQRIRKGTQPLRTGLGKITGNPSAGPATWDRPFSQEPHIDGHTQNRRDDDGETGAGTGSGREAVPGHDQSQASARRCGS